MRRHLSRTVRAALAGVLLLAAGQAAAQRIVFLPFDAEASVEAFAIAFPAALQRAFNEIDGVYAPPVGDAAVVSQRVAEAGGDPLAEVARVFGADVLVLGQLRGSDALTLDLVVRRADAEPAGRSLSGRASDLPAIWRAAADVVLELGGIGASTSDRADARRLLGDAPSLPSLGPVALASARLPGVRLDQLELAASLDGDSAWVQAELARALALAGAAERGRAAAERAVDLEDAAETRALLGVVLLTQGDAGAAAAFEAALARNPAHAVALVGLAQAGPAADARAAALERAVVAAPRMVDAHLALAELQTTPARAVQVLRRASASLPDSLAIQASLVDLVVDAGDARGALDLLRGAVADPVGRRGAVYALAARLPSELARDALAFVREGRAAFPADPDLRRAEIDLLRAIGDSAGADAAQEAWVESGDAPPSEVVAWAESLAARGRVDEAQAWLATVADLDADADLRSAQVDLAGGRARSAIATLEPKVMAGDADGLRRAIYAIALGRVGRVSEAEEILRQVVAEGSMPGADARAADAAALAGRGLASLEEQRRVGGDAAFRLPPDVASAFEQGLYALETGDLAGARDAFARARAVQEAGVVAFYEGYARQMLGDPRGAIAAYQAARTDLGDNDVLLNNLGYAHLQVGRLDLALEVLRSAVAANPDNARAHLNLGLAYYGLARFGDAVRSFDAALGLDPSLASSAGPVIDDARRRATP